MFFSFSPKLDLAFLFDSQEGGFWMFMDVYGCLWMFMDVYGCLWMFAVAARVLPQHFCV
jgi:hypothetical protein